MMEDKLIALLGRRDFPTDALEDYCTCLKNALEKRGCALTLFRMPWAEIGWLKALRCLWQESIQWQGKWVLVQYTALSWPQRVFPVAFVPLIWILRRGGRQVALVFPDLRDIC